MYEKGENHKNNWLNQLKVLGLKPEMRILETIENSNDLDWQERERAWISECLMAGHPLTNLDSGGRGGMKKSNETKARMSAALRGRKPSRESIEKMKRTKSMNMTPELRKRLSEMNLGRKHTEEWKTKMSSRLMGHKTSEETKRKISEAQLGKFVSEETRAKIRIARAKQTFSAETRAKLSVVAKGRKPSPQTIAASVARCKGKPFSAQHRANLCIARAAYLSRKKAALSEPA